VVLATTTIPALRHRRADTGVEMKAGQTLALAGLLQQRTEAQNVGIPWLADLPWFGAAFRRVREEINEIELLVLVTPELVDAMDCHEVPPCGPGMHTVSPNDCDLYWRGHLEVPRCDGVCGPPPGGYGHPGHHEVIPGGIGAEPNGAESAPSPKERAPSAPPGGAGAALSPSARRGFIANPVVRTEAPSPPARASQGQTAQSPSAAGQTWSSDPSRFDYLRERTASTPLPPSNPESPYNRSPDQQTATAPAPAPSPSRSASGGPPGMIGPVGYDVLD
jgi:pilus assembly protein CpaC